MKKSTVLVAALALTATSAFAQLTNKNGEAYLPESGDWSVGIDATPVLNYFGNMIGGNGLNVAPSWNHLNANNTIVGKMMTSETTAYRAILRIGFSSNSSTAMIGDQAQTTPPTYPALPAMVEDKMKSSSRFIGLGGGMEWRRGKGRLQGFYGADAMIWMSGSKSTYEYGNVLDATHPVSAGNTTNFGMNMTTDTYGNAARITEMKGASTLGIGARGFIGVEYFVLPKLAVGGEFGWGLGFVSTGASSTTMESVGGTGPAKGEQTIEGTKSSGLMLDTDRNAFGTGNGTLRINFYF
ncbi:MAG: hypothetical protein L6Q81_13490 [Bacteroidia bacterium]|nr:hypothetical protein [Bacteroidia bacterium]